MAATIDHIASFANRVSGVIYEDEAFAQHSKYHECADVSVFDDFTGILSSMNQLQSQPKPINANANTNAQCKVVTPKPVQTLFIEGKDGGICASPPFNTSFSLLFLVNIDPLVTLKSKEEICKLVSKFRDDLANNLAQVYKSYGFSRKRKITLQSMQESIRNDLFDEYVLTYMSKMLKKNIVVETLGVRVKKQTITYEDGAPSVVFKKSLDGQVVMFESGKKTEEST